jgi:tRNA modification GTPase
MIQNALTKAKYGGRLSLVRRLSFAAPRISRAALKTIQHRSMILNLPRTTRTLSQPRLQMTGFTSFDHEDDTIYALSTASGRAAIAIIRISGPGWQDVRRAAFVPILQC